MRRSYWIVVISITCALVLYIAFGYVRNSDAFQKKYYPEQYWSAQVERIKDSIESNEKWIRQLELDLIEKMTTLPIKVQRWMELIDNDRSVDAYKEMLMDEIRADEEALARWIERVEKQHEDLRNAEAMLHQARRSRVKS